MNAIVRLLTGCCMSAMSLLCLAQPASPANDLILIRTSAKSPNEVSDAIKAYVESKKWVYGGALTVKPKQGDVIMVKLCIPQAGAILWPVGLQLSALLPCGNVGIYMNQGKTEISMLHPRYMQTLYPHPEVERAVVVSTPLLIEMLDSVAK